MTVSAPEESPMSVRPRQSSALIGMLLAAALTITTASAAVAAPSTLPSSSVPTSSSTAAVDEEGPILENVTIDPQIVDISSGPAQITVTMHLTDDSGVAAPDISAQSGDWVRDTVTASLVKGTAKDGTWQATLTVPAYVLDGEVDIYAWGLQDLHANLAVGVSHLGTVTVTGSTNHDIEGPRIHSWTANPSTVDLADGPETVTVTAHVTDETGIGSPGFLLGTGENDYTSWQRMELTSGTVKDGIWTGQVTMPQDAPNGDWTAVVEISNDLIGNVSDASSVAHFTVTGSTRTDYDGPRVVDYSVSQTTWNLLDGPAVITVTADLEDASGTNAPTLFLYPKESEDWENSHSDFTVMTLASGTATKGTWTGQFTVPTTAPTGEYQLDLNAGDTVDNWETTDLGSLTLTKATALVAPVPTIAGDPSVGKTLTANAGIWGPEPVTLAYQWSADGTPIAGAKTSTLALSTEHVGKAITVSVTGTKTGYPTVTKTSIATTNVTDPDTPEPPVSLSDVSEDDWFFAPVQWMVDRAITTGYQDGSFKPKRAVTRAEAVTFLHRYSEEVFPAPAESSFDDVSVDNPYFGAISWASANGVVNGYKDRTFRPNRNMTRGEVAAILYRQADVDFTAPETTKFSDLVKGTTAHYEAIAWLTAEGITTGRANGTFDPGANVIRAEFAAFLERYNGVLTD